MKLIAKKDFRYANKRLSAGDSFEATSKDARVLKAIGRADIDPGTAVEPEDQDDKPQDKPASKRKYKRRDMESE